MKNRIYYIIPLIFYAFACSSLKAENISIKAKNISINKNNEISIFEKEIVAKTDDNNIIKSEYAEYDKKSNYLKLKNDVVFVDNKNNIIKTENAEYYGNTKIFTSIGPTKVITSEKYIIEGRDITFDNFKRKIISNNKTTIIDEENNKIFLDKFEYNLNNNIFKSIGLIKIEDKNENLYEFSQIYIDTKKKEIIGTDSKIFLNQEDFKIDKRNKPRIFSNTINLKNDNKSFGKSIFTLCDYRKKDKCPPWSLQATEMLHDSKKKTIYYENALLKIYNLPIFYFPKLSHPDPSVKRRSGFLPPSFSDTKNLGAGLSIPYFWAISDDKNFTFTNRLHFSENPIFLGEYHQAFKNSYLLTDFGFTEGYKNTSNKKQAGEKSHFFTKFVKNFNINENSESELSVSLQEVSNDNYLKLYKIDTDLVDYNTDTLENSLDFVHEDENFYFSFKTSSYETLKEDYNDKYEYILPEVFLDKNLFSSKKYGNMDLQTNYKYHNFDTNKVLNFLVNDFNWNFKDIYFDSGMEGKILGSIKNINYEAKNTDTYKKKYTNELYGSIGYLSQIKLEKEKKGSNHLLTPKILLRYAPGAMRKEKSGPSLNPINAFSLNRLDNLNNFETGLSSTLGFDYKMKNNTKELDFSVAQVINEKENKKMSSKSSLDEKLSDLVGSTNLKFNNNFDIKYNFSIDQNYKDFNYNEIGTEIDLNPIKVNFDYLQESKHIGDQKYFKTELNYNKGNTLISLNTKRNLISNSAEFYNLSYEYLNDCLKAGIVYRREFYNDSELEAENTLMFKITLIPFGNISSPTINR